MAARRSAGRKAAKGGKKSAAKKAGGKSAAKASKKGATKTPAGIVAWEDDPGAPGQAPSLTPVSRPAPVLSASPLAINIRGTAPRPRVYSLGTPEFRYWTAAEALRRAADYWATIVPNTVRWAVGASLPVTLDAGRDLNAFYTRGGGGDQPGLSFFHDTVSDQTVFSGESPDIVCHELGHAILDAIKPQLWNIMSVEVSSFHESFGDITAVLAQLQLKSVRVAVIAETGGRLQRSSRLSRLSEQLGWAIRQVSPDDVDPNCLRNAVNSFFYRNPKDLPPDNPASLLSSEPHSFSRVFTGGFFEALAGMFKTSGANPTERELLRVSVDIGRLLYAAVRSAPIAPNYYSQIAAHMIMADSRPPFNRKYRDALKGAFVRRGILSLEAAAAITVTTAFSGSTRRRGIVGSGGEESSGEVGQVTMPAEKFGLRSTFLCGAPTEAVVVQARAAAPDVGEVTPQRSEEAAESFVEDLFRRGRVRIEERHADPETRITQPLVRKTHDLVEKEGAPVIERRFFDCGFD